MRPDRDDPLGPAIRRALQDSRTDCPDAEALAAYADRTLATVERRDVERHLSACASCRETLLIMSRAVEAETPARSSPFLLHRWPWLAGAAAAGLAIVLWTALRLEEIQSPGTGDVTLMARDDAREKAPVLPRQNAADAPPVPESEFRDRLGDAKVKRRTDERKQEEAGARGFETQKPAAPRAPAAAPERAAPQPPAASLGKTVPTERDAAERNRMARQGGDSITASWPHASDRLLAVAPAIAWRVWASGVVERSTDGGATWSRETAVDAPAARAIHAPSRDVCWIVGDRGLILRYETGRGWTRLPPPAQVEFVAVEASEALRATITASDGRRFTTSDGGLTWK